MEYSATANSDANPWSSTGWASAGSISGWAANTRNYYQFSTPVVADGLRITVSSSRTCIDELEIYATGISGATTTFAGSGTRGYLNGARGSAQFIGPHYISIDPSGTFALVTVRRPPPYPRIPPSRRRHNTRLAHGVGAQNRFPPHTARPDLRMDLRFPQRVVS